MDERVSLASQPKTRAEYRAAIRAMLDEIRHLFAEMDENQAEFERKQARIEAIGRRTDATLVEIQQQLERLRRSEQRDVEAAA
jgi:chlorite dismutase